jgi:hypothetical protein
MQAIEVFTVAKPSEALAKVITLRESSTGGRAVTLLPATAKAGKESMATVLGLKGQALKAKRREYQDMLKSAMAKEFAGLSTRNDWTGRKLTVSKTGAVGFFLEPAIAISVDPKEAAAKLTDDELMAILVARKAQATPPTINV